MTDPKYSQWLKVDLHIHTNLSKKTKDNDYKGIFSVDTLKKKLKENEVAIFSLTDHNIINVDAYKEYYESYNEIEDPLLLPGVELDLEVEHNGETKKYHTLLIFRDATIEKINFISTKLEDEYSGTGITNPFERKLTISQVVKLFHKEDFFFIPHANRNEKGIVKAYSSHIEDAQEMILLMPSALEKVKDEAEIKYNERFNEFLSERFKDREDIAYINFSDNHFIEKYPCKHKGDTGDHSFYYLKGTKSYETLRLAFIDPKSRIVSTDDYNSINHSLNIIEKIAIKNDSFLLDNTISFSPHLNVIIGGRSSGKSLLYNLLGHKIDKIDADDKYKEKVNKGNISIKSKRDSAFLSITSLSDDLIYINQGDIVRYFEEKRLNELATESNKKDEYFLSQLKFKEHKRHFLEKKDSVIASYQNAYDAIRKKYVLHTNTIERLLDENYILLLDESELLKRFDFTSELSEANALVSDLDDKLKQFSNNKLLDLTGEEMVVIENVRELVARKKLLLKDREGKTQRKLNFIRGVKQLIEDQNKSLSIESKAKEEAGKEMLQLSKDFESHFKKTADLKAKCDEFENYDCFFKDSIELSDDVSLVLEIAQEKKVKDLIKDGLNINIGKQSLYRILLKLICDNSASIKNYPNKDGDTLNKKINKELSDLYQIMDVPTDYLEYADGGSSKDNSPGYNSEHYLEIILRNPKNKLIFIDQPEDNLGNKFIAEKLVALIRELKFQKQFFLVTHNPSIVVYGDAENVIIASNENNRIAYQQIVLEDQDAQKEICDILDGGEYIFDNRSKKYNIKRILRKEHVNA